MHTQHITTGTGGAGSGLVTTSRRSYGRGGQIVLITGETRDAVQTAADRAWVATDQWLRYGSMPPVARPMPGGGYEASFSVCDAE